MSKSACQFVYVEEDGSARELTDEEIAYLETGFHGADGARPYIKFNYKSLTPDGLISGFLERSRLPRRIQKKLEST